MENFPEPPICININCTRPVAYSHTKKSGAKRWRPVCSRCHLASYGAKPLDEGIVEVKKTYCENIDARLKEYKCTTTIPYKGALELDHIDGNVLNNTVDNIQTLCKVCHSYKSHLSNDFKKNRNKQPIPPIKLSIGPL
jgi:5-methylcytosine-specific restriction endonuclease McrA